MVRKFIRLAVRAIFVWPWDENVRTKQKKQTNRNRAIWLVCSTGTNARGFWLVKRTLGWKNFMPEELSRNRFDVILQHDWSIEQCLLHIRVFFGGKTKRPCFDLFIHWLIKQITNTYRNHFSRSFANRPKFRVNRAKITNSFVWTSSRSNFSACRKFVRSCRVKVSLVIWPVEWHLLRKKSAFFSLITFYWDNLLFDLYFLSSRIKWIAYE